MLHGRRQIYILQPFAMTAAILLDVLAAMVAMAAMLTNDMANEMISMAMAVVFAMSSMAMMMIQEVSNTIVVVLNTSSTDVGNLVCSEDEEKIGFVNFC